MPLSGTLTKDFTYNNSFRLQLDWSASQNIGGNYSTVNANLKLVSIKSWGSVTDNTTSPAEIFIDGTKYSRNVSATLGAWGSKLLLSASKNVGHNGDGTKVFNIKGNYYFNITWGGYFVGWVRMEKNERLNNIPRASSASNVPNFTLGYPLTVNISRASSSFKHTVIVYVGKYKTKWVKIAEANNVDTSVTFNFNQSQVTAMAKEIDNDPMGYVRVQVITSNGAGTTERSDGACRIPFTSTGAGTPLALDGARTSDITINVREDSPGQTREPRVELDGTTYQLENVSQNKYRLTLPTQSADAIMAKHPGDREVKATLIVKTLINGVWIRGEEKSDILFTIYNSAPTVNKQVVKPEDTNPKSLNVTKDKYMAIQGISTLRVVVPPNIGKGVNHATVVQAEVEYGGSIYSASYNGSASVIIPIGVPNTSQESLYRLKIVDSRGNKGEVYSTLMSAVPYEPPTVTLSAERELKFNTETNIIASGIYAPVFINRVPMNRIEYIKIQSVLSNEVVGSVWKSLKSNVVGNLYRSEEHTELLDMDKSWDVYVAVKDILSDKEVTARVNVSEGIPMAYMDRFKGSLGLGLFPTKSQSFEAQGGIVTHDNVYVPSPLFKTTNPIMEDSGWYQGNLLNGATLYTGDNVMAGKIFKVGDLVKISHRAKFYLDGTAVTDKDRSIFRKVLEVKDHVQSNSKRIYRLEGVDHWVLSQDVSGGEGSLPDMYSDPSFPMIKRIKTFAGDEFLIFRGSLTKPPWRKVAVQYPVIWEPSSDVQSLLTLGSLNGDDFRLYRWDMNNETGELSITGRLGGTFNNVGWFPMTCVVPIYSKIEGSPF